MAVTVESDHGVLHMTNGFVSYVMEDAGGSLLHRYFGPALPTWHRAPDRAPFGRSFRAELPDDPSLGPDDLEWEYPEFGRGDYRPDAVGLSRADGTSVGGWAVTGWRVEEGATAPDGLPAFHGGGRTLVVEGRSSCGDALLELHYVMFDDVPGVVRWQRVTNASDGTLTVGRLHSLSLDLPADGWEAVHLSGSHIGEGRVTRQTLGPGSLVLESRQGVSSSVHPPFCALAAPGSGWTTGTVLGAQLAYSSDHETVVDVDQFGRVRWQMGLHPDTLRWPLAPDESFCSPEAALVCSEEGLDGMARAFHGLLRAHLVPRHGHPVLLNSWEALYYGTTAGAVDGLCQGAADLGMELFVLDDGWFREQDCSRAPIGDWRVNRSKLPDGLTGAAESARSRGMAFGLWVEPEAVSPTSRLAAAHPDWVLGAGGVRAPVLGRHEWLLDLSLPAVQDHLVSLLDGILTDLPVSYVKWDMNRPLADLPRGGRRGPLGYVLGLYRVLGEVTRRHPDVLVEGCASGGNRLDAGMLAFVGQNWASDDTDPFDRVRMQSGLALCFPPEVLGAHVSASPNHQTGRATALSTRYQVARFFNLGYELDPGALTEEERAEVRRQTAERVRERPWMERAAFHQLGPEQWMMLGDDGRAEVLVFQEHFSPRLAHRRWRVPFLDPAATYEVDSLGLVASGAELAHVGVELPLVREDFHVYALSVRPVRPCG